MTRRITLTRPISDPPYNPARFAPKKSKDRQSYDLDFDNIGIKSIIYDIINKQNNISSLAYNIITI